MRSTSGVEPELFQQHAVTGFGGDMRGLRMRQRVGAQFRQRRHRRGADKAVEQHRNALPPRRERRAENGGKLAAAERRGNGQRIVERRDMARQRGIDHGALARQAVFIDAGAAAGPARTAAAEQSRRDRGRRRGIADAHFAEADEIAIRRHGVITGRDRGEKFSLGQRRLLREVRGRLFERQRNDAQCARRRLWQAD